jgi:TolB-like protein/DNA-binding winged helix-turn-helix (wHTH) protein/tetratricopeptide (TPR) repeat protein
MAGGFRLAEWTVQPQLNTLERNGHTARLEPKVMQVLVSLADHHGELVPKEQLIRVVWADTFVTDEVLTRCISELRKALNDDPKQPRFIETISKGGYRLLPPVEPLLGKTQTEAPYRSRRAVLLSLSGVLLLAALVLFGLPGLRKPLFEWFDRDHKTRKTPAARSIAVLPLENLSGDASQEYFAEGMTDQLITDLAKIGSLRVISRTSTNQFKKTTKPLPEIAGVLNVELIVTGTVARSGDQVRITAQLVDGKNDTHLWAQDFERDLQNVLRLESDIAQDIAREIRVELTKEDGARLQASPTVNRPAHDAYLRGRFQWNKKTGKSLQESIKLYQQAMDSDPGYALAYAGMADSYIVLENDGRLSPTEANPLIRIAARKAVEADPNLADAHMVLADCKEREWDWSGAESEYRRAIELNPGLARAHHWYALLLLNMNRPNEAITEIQQAVDLDPLTDRLYVLEADIYYSAHQYDRAAQIIAMFEEPARHSLSVHYLLGKIGLAKKVYPDAISEFLVVTSAEPKEPDGWAFLTYAYAQGGKRKEALATFAKLGQLSRKRYVAPYWMALAWTGLGDHDKGMNFLNEAYRIRSSNLASIQSDSLFDPMRSDPRFLELLHKIGLPAGSVNRSASE